MEPQIYTTNSYQSRFHITRTQVSILIAMVVLFLGFTLYKNNLFQIVNTNPNVKAVSVISPFFNIGFNKTLRDDAVVTSSPDMISSYKIQGKTIEISLNNPLDIHKTYTVTVKHVSDTSGETITNKILRFTPRDIPFDQLPADQQKAIKAQQPPKNDLNTGPSITGLSLLIGQGLSTDQTNSLTSDFKLYMPQVKTIAIGSNSVQVQPRDPQSGDPFVMTFTVTMDNVLYKASASYNDIETINLQLFNSQTDALVYDSSNFQE